MFHNDEIVRVYAKLGKMREQKWIEGVVLESDFRDDILVQTKYQKVWSPAKYVKHYKKLDYDVENSSWPEVDKFKNLSWNALKDFVSKSLYDFFPNNKMAVDEKEKIIIVEEFSIQAGIQERETIVSFIELPVWNVYVETYYSGNRHEPPSSDVVDLGSSASVIGATKILIESMMKEKIGAYFDSSASPEW